MSQTLKLPIAIGTWLTDIFIRRDKLLHERESRGQILVFPKKLCLNKNFISRGRSFVVGFGRSVTVKGKNEVTAQFRGFSSLIRKGRRFFNMAVVVRLASF